MEHDLNMNFDTNQTQGRGAGSPAEALAMKNAALRAVLGYLEYQRGPGEWFKDETAYRFHRMVEIALEAPCEVESSAQPSRFLSRRPKQENQF
jgi:hypothetical protein